jgi:uncharacterized protein (TIGR03118 family)
MFGLHSKRKTRVARRRVVSFRPEIEALEDRSVPSTASSVFLATDLVSDLPGIGQIQDPTLINAWGIALSPNGGAFWVSSNGQDVSKLYTGDVNGSPIKLSSLVVSIPGGAPTGQVFNPTQDFVVKSGTASAPAVFIFVTENGDVTGWNPGVPPPAPSTSAQLGTHVDGAIFKGVTLASTADGNFLFATDFHNGQVDVFDSSFNLVSHFTDPTLTLKGFAPFNVADINGKLYVTFAKQDADAEDDVAGKGNGFIDVFDTAGHLEQRLVSNGPLNSPWGLALAPSNFGQFSNALLVGNFGDGHISAFDPDTGKFLGQLSSSSGHPLVIENLWGLAFGNGKTAGDPTTLYYSAGPGDETHGLFGKITANPAGTNPVQASLDADGNLIITGSRNDDQVLVRLVDHGQQVEVKAGGQNIGHFDLASISTIQFNGFAGNDFFAIDGRITVNALMQGGAGNDVLIGGGGRNVILGGTGRDLLIGGRSDDLLIAGTTAYDTDPTALSQVLAEWGSADPYSVRIDKLHAGDGVPKLDASTVFDDGVRDTLIGGPGLDLFFASLPDRIHGRVPAEQIN